MSQPILGNFVQLSEGIPKRLRFIGYTIEPRTITDPQTKQPKVVQALILQVNEEDGIPVAKIYSVTSEKHAQQFAPFLADGSIKTRAFTITMTGRGFLREYQTRVG